MTLIRDENPVVLIVSNDLEVNEALVALAGQRNVPLLASTCNDWELVSVLRYHVSRRLAPRQTLHGVFMELFTLGVLISGESGTGKSELALELLTRGHRLIADDAPEFTQLTPDTSKAPARRCSRTAWKFAVWAFSTSGACSATRPSRTASACG